MTTHTIQYVKTGRTEGDGETPFTGTYAGQSYAGGFAGPFPDAQAAKRFYYRGGGQATVEAVAVIGASTPQEALGMLQEEVAGAGGDVAVYTVKQRAGGDEWEVARSGAEQATSVHERKADAVREAREVAHRQAPSRLFIYKVDGDLDDEVEYDSPPPPPSEEEDDEGPLPPDPSEFAAVKVPEDFETPDYRDMQDEMKEAGFAFRALFDTSHPDKEQTRKAYYYFSEQDQ